MKNLPEGAGSPISRMPRKTEGGLRPTHQPNSPAHRLFSGLTTTQLYMHLENLDSDEWTCRAAATKEEAMSLIEGGFQ